MLGAFTLLLRSSSIIEAGQQMRFACLRAVPKFYSIKRPFTVRSWSVSCLQPCADSRKSAETIPQRPEIRSVNQISRAFSSKAMTLRTLGAKQAAALDEELMSTGGFSIDQLMELAGLSVSQAVFKMLPPSKGFRILVACGPGNNGGDGLVAARHLHHYGYKPTVYYPKQSKNDLFQRLTTQLHHLDIPFTDKLDTTSADLIVDAIFGFSFSGEVREPFPSAIDALSSSSVPVLAVDAPSSWNIEQGPPREGQGKDYMPDALISLTAPKPLVQWFKGRHFVGGRFLDKRTAEKYQLDVPNYQGIDQIVEISSGAEKL